MSWIRGLVVCLAAAVVVGVPTAARASSLTTLILDFTGAASDTLDFSGSFSSDNDVAVILFSLAAPTTIGARTTSAATGGFDPILSLFRFSDAADLSTGLLIANNDDADFANGVIDSALQSSPDVDVSPFNVLDAGLYGLVLTQSLNLSTGFLFGQGFAFDDDPIFTCGLYAADPAECGGFVASDGSARTNAFGGTVGITPLEQPAPVPEPATWVLMAIGGGGIASRRRTLRQNSSIP